MQRRILQELRRTPYDPRVWRLAELRPKLFDQPGLADAGLADNQHELSFAPAGAFPAADEDANVLFAADERCEKPGAIPAASTAYAQYPIERHWRRDAFELVRALILNDEQPGRLSLHARGDEHRPRFGRRLDARRDVRRFAEHFSRGVDDDGAALQPDAGDQFWKAS